MSKLDQLCFSQPVYETLHLCETFSGSIASSFWSVNVMLVDYKRHQCSVVDPSSILCQPTNSLRRSSYCPIALSKCLEVAKLTNISQFYSFCFCPCNCIVDLLYPNSSLLQSCCNLQSGSLYSMPTFQSLVCWP